MSESSYPFLSLIISNEFKTHVNFPAVVQGRRKGGWDGERSYSCITTIVTHTVTHTLSHTHGHIHTNIIVQFTKKE